MPRPRDPLKPVRAPNPWQCEGKVRFGGYCEAEGVAKKRRRRRRNKGVIRPYACRFCQGWHLSG